MKPVISAIQFLTVFPLGLKTDEKDLGRAIPWFPIAGLCVGGVSALLCWSAVRVHLPFHLSSALAVLSLAIFSGGLHLDGLADSADGLLSHRSKERILEIMKDSRIGTMGVLALIFVLLIKWLSLSSLPAEQAFALLIVAPCASRAAMSFSLASFPYARQDGLAKVFMLHRRLADGLIAFLIAVTAGWFFLNVNGIIICVVPVFCGILASYYCSKKIGGITGDTLGAVSEIGETLAFLSAAIIFQQ